MKGKIETNTTSVHKILNKTMDWDFSRAMSKSQLFNNILEALITFPDEPNSISNVEILLKNIDYLFEEIYDFDPILFTMYIDDLRFTKSLSKHIFILKEIYDLMPISAPGVDSPVLQKVSRLLDEIKRRDLLIRPSGSLSVTL